MLAVCSISAVLFDMDGLIFDSERLSYEAYRRAALKFGFQLTPQLYMSLCGKTEAGVVAGLKQAYGVGEEVLTWRAYIRAQKDIVRKERGGHVGKKKGLLELLNYLQEHRIPYALASSSPAELVRTYLTAESMISTFSVIVDGSQVTHGKPNPEIFLTAASKISAYPSTTLVLEDSSAGIQAAHAGGFIAGYIFDDLTDLEPVNQGLPILTNLEDLEATRTRADCVFENLAEVIKKLEGPSSCGLKEDCHE